MCVTVPGRVVSIGDDGGVAIAIVDFGGIERTINLTFLPEAGVGDYILTHAGFAVRLAEPLGRLDPGPSRTSPQPG